MAADVACLAARSFAPLMDPETSTISSSERSSGAVPAAVEPPDDPVPAAVTVMTACTSRAPLGRNEL